MSSPFTFTLTFTRRAAALAPWLLAAVFALEFLLFDQFGSRRHTGVYPRWNDQVQYLGDAYFGFEYARAHGLARGLWQSLVNPSAQGTLHDFAAVTIFSLAGPSRSAALALNMLALIAWQAALFFAIRRLSGSHALAFAAAMLPLALEGPWANIPGSAYDFRLDHLAMCALGVTSAVALLTDGFRSRKWSIAFGAAVGVTLLTRFLTGTYFVFIFAGLLAWTLAGAERKHRVTNLALAALITFAIAAPVFWLNREWIWNYYTGHYVGPESAIRKSDADFVRSAAFIVAQLGQRHLGWFFGGSAVAAAAGFAWLGWGAARTSERSATHARAARDACLVGLTLLLAPALVLTLHQQKSEVVISALVPGTLLLVVSLWLAAARRAKEGTLAVAALLYVLAALGFFAQRQLKPAYDAAALADIRQVNTLADYVFTRARAVRLASPRVAVDHITDCLDAQALRIICYERHRVWMPFEMTLPISIAEPAEADVMQRLRESDFVFLAEEDVPPGPYPFDKKLAELRPQLRAWCDEHLRVANRFTLFGRGAVLYEREGLRD